MNIYRERASLIAFLASVYGGTIGFTDEGEPDWPVVTIESPYGQMTWHVSPDDVDLFDFLPEDETALWDGHTTEEKYERLRAATVD